MNSKIIEEVNSRVPSLDIAAIIDNSKLKTDAFYTAKNSIGPTGKLETISNMFEILPMKKMKMAGARYSKTPEAHAKRNRMSP